jgi:hypothetical protein
LLRELLGLQGIRFHGLLNSFSNRGAGDLCRFINILLRHQSLGLFGGIVGFGEAFPLEGHGSFEPGYKFIALLDEERERERCLYLDKLIGVPSCLRFRRWPSDVTATLFFCVRA